MNHEQTTTFWEYRRKKRRILSPVTRGLILGALFCVWILYCYISKEQLQLNSEHLDTSLPIHEVLPEGEERIPFLQIIFWIFHHFSLSNESVAHNLHKTP